MLVLCSATALEQIRTAVIRSGLRCSRIQDQENASGFHTIGANISGNIFTPKLAGWFKGLADAVKAKIEHDTDHKQVLIRSPQRVLCRVQMDEEDSGEILFIARAGDTVSPERKTDVPVIPVPTGLTDMFAKCKEDTGLRIKFMYMLWRYFNQTKFDDRLTLPAIRLMKHTNASSMRVRAYWSPAERAIVVQPNLFNATLDVFIEIFLHEMCHEAVTEINRTVDSNGGHGPVWASWMIKVGLNPLRYDKNSNDVYQDDDSRQARRQLVSIDKPKRVTKNPLLAR